MDIYGRIRAEMGYSGRDDYLAAKVLEVILVSSCGSTASPQEVEYLLTGLIRGRSVVVVGAGDSCRLCGKVRADVVIAADGALRCCLDQGVVPDVVVTDLDGLTEGQLLLREPVYVVHAHGDNLDKVVTLVPKIRGYVLGTNQSVVTSHLRIYGGFTDGDRAAYLAYYFKARRITLVGFDFGGKVGTYSKPSKIELNRVIIPVKLRKLGIALRLLSLLKYHAASEGLDVECAGSDCEEWLQTTPRFL